MATPSVLHADVARRTADLEVVFVVDVVENERMRRARLEVGEAEYPVYAEAVAGYREFMRLVEEYVDLMTGITEEMAIRAREAEDE